MQPEDVKAMIEAGMPGAEVAVSGDGSHFDVTVVSPEFEGKTMVRKQQMVNTILYEKITSGEIHAINIKAYTPDEWKTADKLRIS
ncbi:MAG: BolA/IbaG family iron-sulfur metabolism protein [Pseudomonadota bacterium]